jgi:hypothetical protein
VNGTSIVMENDNANKDANANKAMALTDLADRINVEHEQCLGALNAGLDHAREVGRLLAQVREQLPHGQFQAWVRENRSFSARTARNYLRVFTHWPEIEAKRQRVAVLGYRQAMRLLSSPQPTHSFWSEEAGIRMPGVGEVLIGSTESQRYFIAVAESDTHPGYVNMATVIATKRPIDANYAAFVLDQYLLGDMNVDGAAFDWEWTSKPDVVARVQSMCEQQALIVRGGAS